MSEPMSEPSEPMSEPWLKHVLEQLQEPMSGRQPGLGSPAHCASRAARSASAAAARDSRSVSAAGARCGVARLSHIHEIHR